MKPLLLALLCLVPAVAFASGNVVTDSDDCTDLLPRSADEICVQQTTPPALFCSNAGATAFVACSASGDPTWGTHCALRSNGTVLYCDDDFDGVYDEGEANSLSWATSSDGDTTIPGDLTVTGSLIPNGPVSPTKANYLIHGTWYGQNLSSTTTSTCLFVAGNNTISMFNCGGTGITGIPFDAKARGKSLTCCYDRIGTWDSGDGVTLSLKETDAAATSTAAFGSTVTISNTDNAKNCETATFNTAGSKTGPILLGIGVTAVTDTGTANSLRVACVAEVARD